MLYVYYNKYFVIYKQNISISSRLSDSVQILFFVLQKYVCGGEKMDNFCLTFIYRIDCYGSMQMNFM